MILARLKRPRKILRLGGDFFWERYTDRGGTMGLKEWYASKGLVTRFAFCVTRFILNHFDHVVFSTNYQAELYKKHYLHLPPHCVIENALPAPQQLSQSMRMLRTSGMQNASFRLLYFGRFVGFKNLPALLEALRALPQVKLSLVGEGPMEARLRGLTRTLRIADRVSFLPPLHGTDKEKVFAAHDLLVIPSLTELSPHSALEARAAGLPVLLTEETGLSPELTAGMVLKELRTAEEISNAIRNVIQDYAAIATEATSEPPGECGRMSRRNGCSFFASMKLLMISGDRSILQGKKGAFYHTLQEFSKHWERIDVICPRVSSSTVPRPRPRGGGGGWGRFRMSISIPLTAGFGISRTGF